MYEACCCKNKRTGVTLMSMLPKILSTFSVLVYALVVPYLEINQTHVFNPHWPSHARLHEVWQLITNSAIGVVSLWFIWKRHEVSRANLLTLLVTGGFMLAFVLRDYYGGSMLHSDGTERLLLGMNIGVFGFGCVLLASLLSQMLWKSKS